MNGGQTDVARRHAVLSFAFQMVEECRHNLRTEECNCELGHFVSGSGGKFEEQLQAVAVAEDGLGAASALMWQIVAQEASYCRR